MNIIEIRNLSKDFIIWHEKKKSLYDHIFNRKKNPETISALKNVSFNLKKGECLGIIGKNGSGKSTLLRVIAGIIRPNTGSLIVRGKIVPFIEIGTGFQPDFTGKENIFLYSSLLGIPKEEINERFNEIVKMAELEKFIDIQIKKYSSGMKVRLAFATATQCNPDIFLIDEIFSVGDLSFQKKSMIKIREFKKLGKSIIFVSHSLNDILSICDRCILFDQGKIIKYGNAEEVVNYYSHLIFKEDQQKMINRINKIKEQIFEFESKKNKIKDTNSIPKMNETILKLEEDYSYSIRELKSLLYNLFEDKQKRINGLEIRKNKIQATLDLSNGENNMRYKLKNELKLIENKLVKLEKEKRNLRNELKKIIYLQFENNEFDKFNLFNELKTFFEINLEKENRITVDIIKKIRSVILKELKKDLSNAIKQRFIEELKWVMCKEILKAENINKKIRLIREYKELIL